MKRTFERFVEEDVVQADLPSPTRVGLVESYAYSIRSFSMYADYLLLLSGILEGRRQVITQIEERYTIRTTEKLGRFAELATYDLSKSSD